MKVLSVLIAALAIAACNEVTGPSVPFGQRFTLGPGDQARLTDSGIAVAFQGVTNDSRCPIDAICIQGGDAIVKIRVTAGGRTTPYDLHTGSMAPVVDQGLTITLLELTPYPFSSKPTDPKDYRATLKVER